MSRKQRNNAEVERRYVPLAEVRIKSQTPERSTLKGYAAVFDHPTDIGNQYRERIARGAFRKSINDGADVRALRDHDPGRILGRSKAGTLRVEEDAHGLWFEVDLDMRISYAADLARSVERGDVTGASFAFRPIVADWDDEKRERVLREVALIDVSPTTFPAYEATQVGIRTRARTERKALGVLRRRLDLLRRAALPRTRGKQQ